MEIRESDDEKLVLTLDDVKTLYAQYKCMMFVPRISMPITNFDFMNRLWHAISLIATPDDLDEEKEEFKKK